MITLTLHDYDEVDVMLLALQRLRRCHAEPNVNGSSGTCAAVRLAQRLADAVALDDPDYADAIRRWFPLPLVPRPASPARPKVVADKVARQVTHGSGV